MSRSEPDGAPNSTSTRLPRHSRSHSLLESGMLGPRLSMSHTRLSMDSNRDSLDLTRTSRDRRLSSTGVPGGFFRAGGAISGGVEPLFEFGEEGMPLDDLEEEDEESSGNEERRSLVERERAANAGIGMTRGNSRST